ncbi:MAG: GNAT family N-acetyltransferase [Firmicutes bacterium]|nr:GNAT family N-acetyltransferase [[Eubacterium] siraeum]MCM1488822.1 GNAT family N-acetyltransferase [Bacillota bacterium]
MKICIISFSKRSKGSCAHIASELFRLHGSDQAEIFDFSRLDISPCGGCDYQCFDDRTACPYFSDSVYRLYEEITDSDLVYFIVPNYCDYPCSAFFAFNERSQCYFQGRPELLDKYLSVRKKFIVVSNTGQDNFISAFRYQINENEAPDILFLSAKKFDKISIKGDLTDSQAVRKIIGHFAATDLEPLAEINLNSVREIERDDVPADFADDADAIMELTRYGSENNCIGDTYAIKYKSKYIGVILLGEAIPWETDPPQMREEPFYRLMGFVLDKKYRSMGIGGFVLEKTIDLCYEKYGIRPIALGCHRDNTKAARFYEKHGFVKTEYTEGDDIYYLRYPC